MRTTLTLLEYVRVAWGVGASWCRAYVARHTRVAGNPARELRQAAGLSRAELARRSGVTQPNIAAYEEGRRTASAEMLERLQAATRPLPHDALVAHRADLVSLAGRRGLRNLRVFGSAARGADRPGSDLVTRAPGTGLLAITASAADASELLGVEVDVVTDGGLPADHEIVATAVAV
ncbi:helix-turn-helix domain-containing protein [Pseudactinotalea sp. HY158]|uniref:helix-turn-helix domain-containing protein n=1 Tax=Pseudactinotalea sp. HY158 TaxID=2654547 RepID=UPI00129C98E9|nr:XRE family transcriptional regulator [Pseudactinotalea sp. HY158]QGH70065.1 helix-turn-helix domain-containing protein [Pseudactinotalea sp. HY158]